MCYSVHLGETSKATPRLRRTAEVQDTRASCAQQYKETCPQTSSMCKSFLAEFQVNVFSKNRWKSLTYMQHFANIIFIYFYFYIIPWFVAARNCKVTNGGRFILANDIHFHGNEGSAYPNYPEGEYPFLCLLWDRWLSDAIGGRYAKGRASKERWLMIRMDSAGAVIYVQGIPLTK